MRPTQEQGHQVQSTIQGDVARMSIDQGAMAHIMSILTDLYSDPELAVLREYSTNALDAHVEAGNPDPIEVTIPTALSPHFKVKDYGIGLSVEDIHRIYSQYGASTKRGTDEQVGMLGLGCKSALTYASQFTVTSVKDGTRIAVAVSRDDDGGGSMTVVDTRSTDEPNGVEVSIPARRNHSLAAKAGAFFQWWKAGTVLVNGQLPAKPEGLWLTDDLLVQENPPVQWYSGTVGRDSQVVMGNVAYPIEKEYLPSLPDGVVLIAFVPIGTINFTPSRESLHYTNHTKNALCDINDAYQAAVPGDIQRAVDKATTHAEALATVGKWEKYLTPQQGTVTFTYKGDSVPTEFTVPAANNGSIKATPTTDQHVKLSGSSRLRAVPAASWPISLWVYNHTLSQTTAQHKRKMMKYIADNGIEGVKQMILLVANTNPSKSNKFIDPARCVDWEVIRALKLDNVVSGGSYRPPRVSGSFDVYTRAKGATATVLAEGTVGQDIDQSKPVYWLHGDHYDALAVNNRLALYVDEFTLVRLPGGRIKKFCREMPKAQEARQAIHAMEEAWAKTLTHDQLKSLYLRDRKLHIDLERIDPDRVDDPELQSMVRLAMMDVAELQAKRHACRARMQTMDISDPLKRYPLFNSRTLHTHPDHVYTYLNGAFASDQKERYDHQ